LLNVWILRGNIRRLVLFANSQNQNGRAQLWKAANLLMLVQIENKYSNHIQ